MATRKLKRTNKNKRIRKTRIRRGGSYTPPQEVLNAHQEKEKANALKKAQENSVNKVAVSLGSLNNVGRPLSNK